MGSIASARLAAVEEAVVEAARPFPSGQIAASFLLRRVAEAVRELDILVQALRTLLVRRHMRVAGIRPVVLGCPLLVHHTLAVEALHTAAAWLPLAVIGIHSLRSRLEVQPDLDIDRPLAEHRQALHFHQRQIHMPGLRIHASSWKALPPLAARIRRPVHIGRLQRWTRHRKAAVELPLCGIGVSYSATPARAVCKIYGTRGCRSERSPEEM